MKPIDDTLVKEIAH